MSESNGESKQPRLTINDPVDKRALVLLTQLREAKTQMALQLVDIEQRKIHILGAIKRVDEQTQKVFDAILVDRGIAPGTPVELDGNTGAIKLINQPPAGPKTSEEEPTEEPPQESGEPTRDATAS